MARFKYTDKSKFASLPKGPGVYVFKKGAKLLYIGKAENIKERVKSHFQQPGFRDNLFISEVSKIGYIKTQSEIEALILEAELIKKEQPKFNILWRDDKNYFYVGITKEDFPRVFITHQPLSESGIRNQELGIKKKKIPNSSFIIHNSSFRYVGPFVDGKALKATLKILRRAFPYRSCKKIPKRVCLWHQLNRCPAPCQIKIKNQKSKIKNQCQRNTKNIIKILQAKKTQVLRDLKREMKKFSQSQEYERAAKIRNQIKALENILKHTNIFLWAESAVIRKPWLSYYGSWKKVEKALKDILKVKRKILRIEGYDVSNIQGVQATGAMIVFEKGEPNKNEYRKFKIKIAEKPNDVAMLKEIISRRLNHPEWKFPQVMLIDGGRAQLNAALSRIRNKELGIRVMSLAKRKNELFIAGKKKPVLLKELPQEISNLILHIRDEAHRFAITYHKKLRKKAFINQ